MTIVNESAAPDAVAAATSALLEAAAASGAAYTLRDLHRRLAEAAAEAVLGDGAELAPLGEKAAPDAVAWRKRTEIPARPPAGDEQARKRAEQNARAKAELAKKMMAESAFHTDGEKAAFAARADAWLAARAA